MNSGKATGPKSRIFYGGPIKITPLSKSEEKEFSTIGEKTTNCTLLNYQYTDSEGTVLRISYCTTYIDNHDIQGTEDHSSHTRIRMLGEVSRRLGIYPVDESEYYVVIKQVRPIKRGSSVKPSLQIATIEQLQKGSGVDFKSELCSSEASDIYMKEVLLNDSGKDRNSLCVTSTKENKEVQIKAYVINRVLPLLKNYIL